MRQSRITARHCSGTRNIPGLTENVGRIRAARCFRIVKILSHQRRNSLCTANREFESRADSQKKNSSPAAKIIRQFSTVWLYLFLRDIFFVIPQFLGNPLHNLIGRAYFSIPILRTSLIVGIRALYESHKEQYQNFSVPVSDLRFLLQLRIIFSELCFLLERRSQLSVP